MNLQLFNKKNDLHKACKNLFETQLGFKINNKMAATVPIDKFLTEEKTHWLQNEKYLYKDVKKCVFLGRIKSEVTNDYNLFSDDDDDLSFETHLEKSENGYPSISLMAIQLKKSSRPSRTQIAQLTRFLNQINKNMPTVVVLKYKGNNNENLLSIATSERTNYIHAKKSGQKIGKISMLKDINTQQHHTAHLKILQELSIKNRNDITNFNQLYAHWKETFNIEKLNKRFYQDIANWYFWAVDNVSFPNDKDQEQTNKIQLIRFLTRIMFVWFVKEKGLVEHDIFTEKFATNQLKTFTNNDSNYYKAILQNLFFATLNAPSGNDRRFKVETKDNTFHNPEQGIHTLYRYADLFKNKENIIDAFKHIPFLNGGLFDCLDNKDNNLYIDVFTDNKTQRKKLTFPNFLLFGEERIVDLNKVYGTKNKTYYSRGLFHIFNKYKFTVAENTPLEQEVALDPELLGQIFENLLAEYNPETSQSARKESGSFYTPRPIVNYMVDESLRAYLINKKDIGKQHENDIKSLLKYEEEHNPFDESMTQNIIKALFECKIFDPACGSGAFPMGVLQKMLLMLEKLDPTNDNIKTHLREKQIGQQVRELKADKETVKHLSNEQLRAKAEKMIEDQLLELENNFNPSKNELNFARKLYLIQNCIYGVDIQSIAMQITRLRCFIAIIIEQKTNRNEYNQGILPLPNLDTKFIAANTLLSLEKQTGQRPIKNLKVEDKEKEIKKNRAKHFETRNKYDKRECEETDRMLRKELAVLLKSDGWKQESAQKIADWDLYDQNAPAANWFDAKEMFGIDDGFDIVIGNPPYVAMKQFKGKPETTLLESQNFETFTKTGDIYFLFYEKGIQLLKPKGILNFITSNKWMRVSHGKKLRFFFSKKYNPLLLIDFGRIRFFESVAVNNNILVIEKNSNKGKTKACFFNDNFNKQKDNIVEFIAKNYQFMEYNKGNETWGLDNTTIDIFKKKIEKIGTPLKDWDINIYRGVLTGYNDAFIINETTKEELIQADPKNAEIIKPILRGRDIKKYKAAFADLWLIHSHNGLRNKNKKIKKKWIIPPIDIINDYPTIYQHLLNFEEKAKKRQDKGSHWTNLRNCAYFQEFEKEKIVWQAITKKFHFYYDKENNYTDVTTFIMTGSELKFILGILNSTFFTYAMNKIYLLGDTFRSKNKILQNFPIPKIPLAAQQPFIEKVEKILAEKAAGKDTFQLESDLDQMIYKLYNLSEEEIQLIENS